MSCRGSDPRRARAARYQRVVVEPNVKGERWLRPLTSGARAYSALESEDLLQHSAADVGLGVVGPGFATPHGCRNTRPSQPSTSGVSHLLEGRRAVFGVGIPGLVTMGTTSRRLEAFLAGGLVLAVILVAACGASVASDNDPVPMPADLAAQLGDTILNLLPPEASVPRISAAQAVEIAGEKLLTRLERHGAPPQDPSVADGLIRRRLPAYAQEPARIVWIVAYRWKADVNCDQFGGPPGPCRMASTFLIDDQTAEVVGGGEVELRK
jgi:hypothetical protein